MTKQEQFNQAFNKLWHLSDDGQHWHMQFNGGTIVSIDCIDGQWVYRAQPDKSWSDEAQAIMYVSHHILKKMKEMWPNETEIALRMG